MWQRFFQKPWQATRWRSEIVERDRLREPRRVALAGCLIGVRPAQDALQSLQALKCLVGFAQMMDGPAASWLAQKSIMIDVTS